MIKFFLILLMSASVFAESDFSLYGSFLYNYSTNGIFSGGDIVNTDTDTIQDFDPVADFDSSYGVSLQLRRKLRDSYFLYSSFEYNQDMKVRKIDSSSYTSKPDDTTARFIVLDFGFGKSWEMFNLYGGINLSLPHLEDHAPGGASIVSKGGIGWGFGAEYKFNNKHSIGLDFKALNVSAEAELDNYEFDYGDGVVTKRALIYRYNFGNIFD